MKLKQNERLASSEKSDRENITRTAAMRRKGNGEPGGNETKKQSREQEESKNEGKEQESDREGGGRKGESEKERDGENEKRERSEREARERGREAEMCEEVGS